MKSNQNLAVWALAGFCSTALSLPQVPYYASRFPQHPQNLGYQGDYPKYWQGEAYNPTDYYNRAALPAAVPTAADIKEGRPPHPSFTDRKYPAREAIKHYSETSFPVNDASTHGISGEDSPNKGVQDVKATNGNPNNKDKSYSRVTKGPGIGQRRKKTAPAETVEEKEKKGDSESVNKSTVSKSTANKSTGMENIADAATPKFDDSTGAANEEQDDDDDNWNSFTYGVVSDSLVYHDPYENREGDFERKTNALQKIERMMGRGFGSSKNGAGKHSLSKRDWPEHIQEKASKMMEAASSMQIKGQKTIDNDPQYQESLKAKGHEAAPDTASKSAFPVAPKSKDPKKQPARVSEAAPKSTFPVTPKSKDQTKQPVRAPAPASAPQASPSKKVVGSGRGGLVPSSKAGKLGKVKGTPQNQPASRPDQRHTPQNKQPNSLGNKHPQQRNMPVQGRNGSGLNTSRQGNPQNPQKAQRKPQQTRTEGGKPQGKPQGKQPQGETQGKHQGKPQGKRSQGKPQRKPHTRREQLMKRQISVPAGPEYPPGTMITRITRPAAPVNVVPVTGGYEPAKIYGDQVQQRTDGQLFILHTPVPIHVPAPPPAVIRKVIPAPHPAPIFTPKVAPVPTPIVPAPVPVMKEKVQFAAIVHPGEVICPENKHCPPPASVLQEKTYLQPVQRMRDVEVTREAIQAVPKFEPVEVTRYVDVEKEMQVEKQVMVKPICETCMQEREKRKPKTITTCSACRGGAEKCTCEEDEQQENFGRTYPNGKEAVEYRGSRGTGHGPVSTPGGLEAFFRERLPEHFEH